MAASLLFPTQVFFSLVILSFTIYMLSIGKDPGIYLPILTGIMGYWLPQPTHEGDSASSLLPSVLNRLLVGSGNGGAPPPIQNIAMSSVPSQTPPHTVVNVVDM